MADPQNSEAFLDAALAAVDSGDELEARLDAIPVPVYVTDAEGHVTYWNRACVDFAGREPERGSDRWCVTWQLFTMDGDPLAHEDCPMAAAIKERRPIRDEIAIALRPDGTRAAFTPYPTPIFDESGQLTGAVNMLIDVSAEQSESLARQAGRCRRLADATYDRSTSSTLTAMAAEFERTSADLKRRR